MKPILNHFCYQITTAVAAAILLSPALHAETIITLDPFPVVANSQVSIVEVEAGTSARTSKPLDLASVLANEMPGVAKARRGPVAGDIVLRGLSRDNLIVSVDQTKTYCACPNRMDPPAFHVSSQQIESVRVRNGPFSVDQGPSLGGKVQVFTRAPAENAFLDSHLFAGSFDYWAGGISAGSPVGENGLLLGGVYFQRGDVYQDGDGRRFTEGANYRPAYRKGSAFDLRSADARLTWQVGEKAAVGLAYGFQDATDVLYPGLRMDALRDRMHRASVSWTQQSEGGLADSWSVTFAVSDVDHDMRDSFRMSSDPAMNPMLQNPMMAMLAQRVAERGFFMRTEARSASYALQTTAEKQLPTGLLRYGGGISRRLWDADNTVGPNTNDMLPDVALDSAGAWAVYEARYQNWDIEFGGRLDTGQTRARDSIAFLQSLRPGAEAEVSETLPSAYFLASTRLGKHFRAYGGIGSAARFPDPQERYIQLNRPGQNPDWIGNPLLRAPRNTEIQSGLRYRQGSFSLDSQLFHAWLSDHILWEAGSFGGITNVTSYAGVDARLYGFQANARWQLNEQLHASGGLAWQRGVLDQPNAAGNRNLAEIPPLRARLALQWVWQSWSVQATWQHQQKLERIDTTLNERPLPGWTTVDFHASWRINHTFSVSGGVDNAFDENYAVANSFVRDPFSNANVVHEPGRFFYARIDARF